MDRNQIINTYFDWLYDFACQSKNRSGVSYRKLLSFLHSKEFIYLLDRDSNRAEDGVALRWRFACDAGLVNYYREIEEYLSGPCSVLEMILALAIRCEETIMDNTAYGNRIRQWFWKMIDTMGLGGMTDDRFDRATAEHIVDRFLNREYEPNGKGGLFIVNDGPCDIRDVEIWTQLCWYLDRYM